MAGLDGDVFQNALRRLITTNIVVISPDRTESGLETRYELGDLPRLYIAKNHPPTQADVLSFLKRRREIVATHERLSAAARMDAYTIQSLVLRTPDDAVAATYLIDALKKVRDHHYTDAFELIERAKTLAPSYYEVFRVEGWAHAFAGDLPAARDSYETALELAPESAPLRLWYAGCLLRLADDVNSANEQLEEAIRLDPQSPYVQAELGRVKMYLRRFNDADALFEQVVSSPQASLKLRRIAYDGWLQSSLRRAEAEFDRGEYISSHECIDMVLQRYRAIPRDFLDFKMIETMGKCIPVLSRVEWELGRSDYLPSVLQTRDALNSIIANAGDGASEGGLPLGGPDDSGLKDGEVYSGHVQSLVMERKYGFIKTSDTGSVFFHQSALPPRMAFERLWVGQEVRFVARRDKSDGRMRATDIVIISEKGAGELHGIVKSYGYNGQNFGFISGDDGNEYFFHRNNITEQRNIDRLLPGTRVRFILGSNEKGVVADTVALADRGL